MKTAAQIAKLSDARLLAARADVVSAIDRTARRGYSARQSLQDYCVALGAEMGRRGLVDLPRGIWG